MKNLNSKKARQELIELLDHINLIKNIKADADVSKGHHKYWWLEWAKLYTELCNDYDLNGNYRGVAETIIDRAERDPEEYKRKDVQFTGYTHQVEHKNFIK